MTAGTGAPAGVARVRESREGPEVPLYRHPDWGDRFPWLVQGTTGEGEGEPFDLGLFGEASVGPVLERWRALREQTGMPRAVHSHQVHRTEVLEHDDQAPGLLIAHGFDGHLTRRPGTLLTVSVADCVPISMVDPATRTIAVLHGGWRGTAAGVLERGLERLGGAGVAERIHLHMGPAICGRCYEVGPEVHEALGLPRPDGNTPVDLRAVQAARAAERGVPPGQITISEHCTRCGTGFFSHRGGRSERQMGVLGIRP